MEIDQIIKQVADLNAKIEVFRARMLEHDGKLEAYRQEIQQLRSQTGEGRKDRKAQIRRLKFFANQAKKARKSEHIRIKVYTQKVQELGADFGTFFREASE